MPDGSVPHRHHLVVWYDTSPAVPAFTDIHIPKQFYHFRAAFILQLRKVGLAPQQVPAQGDVLLLIAG